MKLQLQCFLINDLEKYNCINVSVSDKVFGYPFNPALIHQIVSSYLINCRQGSKSQKSRSDVSGSNKKPWRQKGTGRARSGSVKSPIWRSGGVTFASKPKKYDQKINKKMYKGAMKSILSKLVCDNRLFLIEDLFLEKPKTNLLLKKLKNITSDRSVLIVTDNVIDKNLILASSNLHTVKIYNLNSIDPVSLINFNITLLFRTIVESLELRLS
ncbi:50S ribosomal subunit protein L4 [Candidatus Blochmanniella floridana]|uniref:Large ribosomal subunit protein uL4 n=1 Tax=Blochmanniella floridana TaxID=203907 RepID=RL4_BLOFL|nr:RecName: Full=Large ribosomal subunit protein uL4; AltName: Full=50S ribosomal protein L4 [Candidatus Blochmannia floridanus]CAD83707.1 50S ribosomal subunit protein L4 [Candidatus Blochmannia floridanus]